MAGKFEIKKAKNGQFYFNLKASNGEIVLTSEQYKARAGAKNGIESVRSNSTVDDRFERKTTGSKKPYFVLKAGNGRTLGRSQTYSTAATMEKGIASVKSSAGGAPVEDLA